MSEALEEITQELVSALFVVLMGWRAKEGIYFTFGYRESDTFHDFDHVGILHFEGDPQLAKDHRIVDPIFWVFWGWSIAWTATFKDQSI